MRLTYWFNSIFYNCRNNNINCLIETQTKGEKIMTTLNKTTTLILEIAKYKAIGSKSKDNASTKSGELFEALKIESQNNKPLDYAGLGGVLGLGVWFNFSFCIFSIVIFLYLFTYSRQFLDFNWYKYLQKIMFIVLGVLIISAPSILSMFMNGQGVLINPTNDYIFNNFDIDEFIYQIIRNFSEYLAMFNYLGESNPMHNVVGFPMLDLFQVCF